jgi:hypothetical protein
METSSEVPKKTLRNNSKYPFLGLWMCFNERKIPVLDQLLPVSRNSGHYMELNRLSYFQVRLGKNNSYLYNSKIRHGV